MEENRTTGFVDPFAGTPKAATETSYGIDNVSDFEKLVNGTIERIDGYEGC